VIRAKILLLLALCCLHLALLRPVVCVLCRRSSCATPATGSRSSARRTRTATSASRHAPSASTAAIRSAFELACTDEVSTNLLASTVHNTDRPLQGSRGYPRGYIKGFISSQNSPLFSGSTFNIPSRLEGICRNLSGVKVWLTLHKLIWSFRQQRAIYTLIALL